MITILNYGSGNLRSIQKILNQLGYSNKISNDIRDIKLSKALIMPGVGHFDTGMKNLKRYNLIEALNETVILKKIPILGICLGFQLFAIESEEGSEKGLKWLNAKVHRFQFDTASRFKVPHIGWNTIEPQQYSSIINALTNQYYYFVHSYYVKSEKDYEVIGKSNYGTSFDSLIINQNIWGVQFHPEKSYDAGIQLLKTFFKYYNVSA